MNNMYRIVFLIVIAWLAADHVRECFEIRRLALQPQTTGRRWTLKEIEQLEDW